MRSWISSRKTRSEAYSLPTPQKRGSQGGVHNLTSSSLQGFSQRPHPTLAFHRRNEMKKSLLAWAFAALACFAAPAAQAAVVCNSCDFIGGASVATYLGEHNTLTKDNSTFSNATTGQNGDFVN